MSQVDGLSNLQHVFEGFLLHNEAVQLDVIRGYCHNLYSTAESLLSPNG